MKESILREISPMKYLGKKKKKSPIINKNKSIFEFFDSNSKSKAKNKLTTKKTKQKEDKNYYPLLKNISIMRKPGSFSNNKEKLLIDDSMNIEKIQLFNEETIDNLIPSFTLINDCFNKAFNSLGPELPISYYTDDYFKFIKDNIQSILIKYFLQFNNNTICIPKAYFNNKEIDPSKLALLTGFNSLKKTSLQYNSINAFEAKNENNHLYETIQTYIKRFKYNQNYNRDQKALVLFKSNNHTSYEKSIELIFKDLEYQILRIDELENQKVIRLNKIAEATKSQPISCLPEIVNDKIKIIEALSTSSKCNEQWRSFIQKSIEDKDKDKDSINDIKEKAYNLLEYNVFQTCFVKKSILFLIDSFSNGDEDKAYLNNIATKIPQTKCPIVILTNNLIQFKSLNMNNLFTFESILNETESLRKCYLCLLSFVLFIHLVLNKEFEGVIEFETILTQMKETLSNEGLIKEMEQFNVFDRIIRLVIWLLCENKTNLNQCQIILYYALKQIKANQSVNDKLIAIEKKLFHRDIRDDQNNKKIDQIDNITIDSLAYSTEIASINDQTKGNIDQFFNRRFKRLTGLNNIDPIVNCENHFIDPLFSLNHIDNSNERNKDSLFVNSILHQLRRQNRRHANYHLGLTHVFVTNKSYNEYNTSFKYMNDLEVNKLYELLNIRLPRMTQLKTFPSNSLTQEDKMKQNALNKFIKNYSPELFSSFVNAHKHTNLYYTVFDNYFLREDTLNYFEENKQLNELSKR